MKRFTQYLILLGWLLLTAAELAFAVPVTFEWTPDATHKVVHLKTVVGSQFLFLGEQASGFNRLTVEMTPGTYRVAATAQIADGRWAEHSDPINVVVEASVPDFTIEGGILTVNRPCRIKLAVQGSADLDHWSDQMQPGWTFHRVKATSISP